MVKYIDIADDIRSKIFDKKYTYGQKLPYEYVLCVAYHCNKETMKKALDILVKEGLIVRRRGAGNYHIFKLMIKNHKDSRIQLKNIHPLDFDLVFDVYTSLDQKTVISILSHELRYSPFMYLCPGFKVIPLKKRLPHGTKESTTPLNLSFN